MPASIDTSGWVRVEDDTCGDAETREKFPLVIPPRLRDAGCEFYYVPRGPKRPEYSPKGGPLSQIKWPEGDRTSVGNYDAMIYELANRMATLLRREAIAARPLSEIYDHILFFGDSSEMESGKTTVGGTFRSPVLSLSFLLAARRLIDDARTAINGQLGVVAFPIAYMQRHAFELALKGLIESAFDILHSREWRSRLMQRGKKAKLPEQRSVTRSHEFTTILKRLRKALKSINFATTIEPEIVAMADRLTAIEQQEPSRLRYEGFMKAVVLELGAVQDDLEELFHRHFWARGLEHANDQGSIYGALALESQSIGQTIYALESHHGMTKRVEKFDGEDDEDDQDGGSTDER